MAITRPTADQLTFRSSANGVQNLDLYLEDAERGGRKLGDLLSDLFDTTGQFANDAFQFRVNSTTRQLQVRVGTFTDPEDSWADLAGIFRPQGTYIANNGYSTMDVVGDGTDLYLVTDDIAINEIANVSEFRSSSKTFKILIGDTVGAAASYATQAEDARDLADTYQGQALTYRNEAQSYASGTPTDGTSSALVLRNEAQTARDSILNNSAFIAVGNDLNSGASSVLTAIEPYLDEINTLINGVVSSSSPTRYNIDDVNSVAANMQNITTVVGLDTRMADILAFESQITAVGNDLVGNNHIAAVAGASQQIITVGNDLVSTNSQIAAFNDGLSATIDDLTINGVARGSVFYDNINPGTFDLEESNNFVFDYAEWPSHNGVIEFKNAHNCREMQPFTIAIKQSTTYHPTSSYAASLTFAGWGGAGYNFKYPNGVAPTLTATASNADDIITIGGYVLSPDPNNQTATIVIGHMVNG